MGSTSARFYFGVYLQELQGVYNPINNKLAPNRYKDENESN